MSNLKTSLSDQEFERFVSEGYFTVRRSDKFWCGVWNGHNYRAGQMRSIKVSGGLTQGRNMSDGVVARWICTMPGSLQNSPFNQSEEFTSLSSGIAVDDRVNCDSAEELGENAAKGIVGKRFADVTLKRKVQVFTLAAMENTKLIDTDPVVFNPNQLFHRIACVLRSADDLEGSLHYEWAP
ncbi:hypothetical protein AVEN_182522-1 [Araneus ventricosus]|uniref:Uncharacterized protein n=1 Tax=Araneus ventricosus TaxID=182803 RepID=A0A4Y2BXP6_ARAVE|nr:hypothetical protein AVEN_182522-1 [Araneus ventricosus]